MSRWILTVIAGVLLIAPAFAQNQPLACQADKAAGLDWERNEWEVTEFKPNPAKFILVLRGNSLNLDSVAKFFNDSERMPTCSVHSFTGQILCTSGYINGDSLFFSPRTMKGARAKLFGGTQQGPEKRDSVSVTTFTCQPF